MQTLSTCLWFNNNGEEAAKFYTSLFKNSKIHSTVRYTPAGAKMSGQPEGSVMTVDFEIEGTKILALNGGPIFKMSPAFSYTVWCKDEAEINQLWKALSEGGQVRMGLDKYPWSEKYGWVADRFGLDWQLNFSKDAPVTQKIAPSLLFVKKLYGRAQEAIDFYTKALPNSKVDMLAKDGSQVQFSLLSLNGSKVTLMEGQGEHAWEFTHGNSFMVNCESQAEIDACYDYLMQGGKAEPCGWLVDKFGVSWQVAPTQMARWMQDPQKSNAVMAAMNGMKKIDLNKLKAAYES